MSEQAKALELAAHLDDCASVDFDGVFVPSAAELRRLHRVNAELLEAIETQAARMAYAAGMGASEWESFLWPEAVAARARALGQSKGE